MEVASEVLWKQKNQGIITFSEMAHPFVCVCEIVLFGRLPQSRPAHGTKMRWRDRVKKDLVRFDLDQEA